MGQLADGCWLVIDGWRLLVGDCWLVTPHVLLAQKVPGVPWEGPGGLWEGSGVASG